MTLYGSLTSPYVRRLRLVLSDWNYDFISLNIWDNIDRNLLRSVSPVLKIPVLQDDEQVIWDSRQIFEFLVKKNLHHKLSWPEQNVLTTIDGVQDSLINSYLLKRSGVESLKQGSPLEVSHRERLELGFDFLNKQLSTYFVGWTYLDMSLLCLLEWVHFRELYDLSKYPAFSEWLKTNKSRAFVEETKPRL